MKVGKVDSDPDDGEGEESEEGVDTDAETRLGIVRTIALSVHLWVMILSTRSLIEDWLLVAPVALVVASVGFEFHEYAKQLAIPG